MKKKIIRIGALVLAFILLTLAFATPTLGNPDDNILIDEATLIDTEDEDIIEEEDIPEDELIYEDTDTGFFFLKMEMPEECRYNISVELYNTETCESKFVTLYHSNSYFLRVEVPVGEYAVIPTVEKDLAGRYPILCDESYDVYPGENCEVNLYFDEDIEEKLLDNLQSINPSDNRDDEDTDITDEPETEDPDIEEPDDEDPDIEDPGDEKDDENEPSDKDKEKDPSDEDKKEGGFFYFIKKIILDNIFMLSLAAIIIIALVIKRQRDKNFSEDE